MSKSRLVEEAIVTTENGSKWSVTNGKLVNSICPDLTITMEDINDDLTHSRMRLWNIKNIQTQEEFIMSNRTFKSNQSNRMAGCIQDVMDFDADFNITHENNPTPENLFYNVLALAGEAGEVANVAKKMWRDGITPELKVQFEEELIDMIIYFVKVLKISETDFDAAWTAKHNELYARWNAKQVHARQTLVNE